MKNKYQQQRSIRFGKRLGVAWVKLVFAALLDEEADMRQTFFASAPSLELMANIFSPSVRESFP